MRATEPGPGAGLSNTGRARKTGATTVPTPAPAHHCRNGVAARTRTGRRCPCRQSRHPPRGRAPCRGSPAAVLLLLCAEARHHARIPRAELRRWEIARGYKHAATTRLDVAACFVCCGLWAFVFF